MSVKKRPQANPALLFHFDLPEGPRVASPNCESVKPPTTYYKVTGRMASLISLMALQGVLAGQVLQLVLWLRAPPGRAQTSDGLELQQGIRGRWIDSEMP